MLKRKVVDLFAGPGGWSEAVRALGLTEVGFELDEWACATRAAAGHLTIRADVAAFPVDQLGDADGLIASPPCPGFSNAGDKLGRLDLPRLRAHVLHAAKHGWSSPGDGWNDWRSPLTLEPMRWILATRPRWIALEQVPAVLPIWQTYAVALAGLGYVVAVGVVDAVDFGVPQHRKRAVLIARNDTDVPLTLPTPTHRGRHVSMAEALGWQEPREVGFPRRYDGLGESTPDGYRARDWRPSDRPAFTVTEKDRSTTVRPVAVNTGRDWKPGGSREDAQTIPVDQPAPTLGCAPSQWRWDFDRGARRPLELDGKDRWTTERPAYTITGTTGGGSGTIPHSDQPVNLTETEGLILQSFPPDYPVQGRTSQQRWQQIGNAVPPALAHALLAHVTRPPTTRRARPSEPIDPASPVEHIPLF